MSNHSFHKYQGTGNDFIIFDSLKSISKEVIISLCNRRFGIGADGVILMHQGENNHFDMMYYNADGSASFCGNGSRCSVMHAQKLGWIENKCTFNSNDGLHEAFIESDQVHLKMHDVHAVKTINDDFVLNTGSPHYIQFVDNLDLDIVSKAQEIRFSDAFKEEGINVNFCVSSFEHIQMRTYERGVENETLSCGTGVTAAVIADYVRQNKQEEITVRKVVTRGGDLAVSFEKSESGFMNIYLIGPAVNVFTGTVAI